MDEASRDIIKEGMAKKTAELFVSSIPRFIQFLKDIKQENKLYQVIQKNVNIDINHPLYKKSIVMTGFRDKELTELIESVGANNSSSVSKNTFILLAKSKDEDSGKASDARRLNIPIMTPEEFKEKYF